MGYAGASEALGERNRAAETNSEGKEASFHYVRQASQKSEGEGSGLEGWFSRTQFRHRAEIGAAAAWQARPKMGERQNPKEESRAEHK